MKKCGIFFFTIWGITPIFLLHFYMNSIEECKIEGTFDSNSLKTTLIYSTYSTFILSFCVIIDIIKTIQNKYFLGFTSFIILINLISGCILFFTLVLPTTSFYHCSNKIHIIIGISALITEIIFASLCLLAVILVFVFFEGLFRLAKFNLILPFKTFNIKKISFLVILAWEGLILWGVISFAKISEILYLGLTQIGLTTLLLYLMKFKKDKTKYCLNLVIIISLSVYFVETSFSSIGFYPVYFVLKKAKKLLKSVCANRSLRPTRMPEEPPAIFASGEVEL